MNQTQKRKKAVILLSGGLDSATVLYEASAQDYELKALTLLYGQRHGRELDFAKELAASKRLEHHIVEISLPWKGSALLDEAIAVPAGRDEKSMAEGIPVTYVPARNSIFLSFAASFAEASGAEAIFIGANVLDYSGYPDCRPEYFEAFETMIEKGTKAGSEGRRIRIEVPLLKLSKKEIIELGTRLGVPYEKTWSCYQGQSEPCGVCDSCQLRAKGFREAGKEDPLLYEKSSH